MTKQEEFIREHRNDDVRQLALLAARYPDVDMPKALQQIAGWQTARTKLPQWAAIDGIIYPPRLSMEQCSSEATAKYKAKVGAPPNLPSREAFTTSGVPLEGGLRGAFIDLTGGFGVDFSYMARGFQKAVYVERNPQLCEIARHNFRLLGLDYAEVVCADGTDYLKNILPNHLPTGGTREGLLIYLDPARRDVNGLKTYAIGDCTPDVAALKDLLLEKAELVMVKLSPMLDWHKAVDDLGNVSQVHIVSVDNECKELLLVMMTDWKGNTQVYCVNILGNGQTDIFTFDYPSETNNPLTTADKVREGLYLYEPNASIMKAGCFAEVADRYDVLATGNNSHLFVSPKLIPDFQGRKFQIEHVTSLNKKELKQALGSLRKANITVRNFPLSVADLRKRLKLADGGDTYIFATTLGEKVHVLLITKQSF